MRRNLDVADDRALLLTVRQTANALGISMPTVRGWIKARQPIAPVRLGRVWRFRRADIQSLIDNGTDWRRPATAKEIACAAESIAPGP